MLRAVASLFLILSSSLSIAQTPPPVIGKAYIVADVSSGQILASEKADERFEPASLTKIMTAYLVFQALRDKKLTLDRVVPVSEKAWRASGSRMFIDPKNPVSVDQLIRGMIVQSGNDACIALAEAIGGSEDVFAQMMNREAQRLGMKNSNFMNSNGLPDAQHYSSARDMYLLASALVRDFPAEYSTYYSIKEYRFNNITQMNRNRLLWLDPTVDGMKTGFTEAAGYCLVASSKRGPRRLMSVLLGSTSESTRAQESQKLLNWGFQFFDAVKLYDKGQAVKSIEVWKGAAPEVKAGFPYEMYITIPKGQADKVKADLLAQQPLMAPVSQGQKIGVMRVTLDGKPIGEYPVVALESVAVAGILGRAWDTLRLWIK
ncbi:MAG: D-alanyl-D-alanine carboxypeptidase family protein [Betaproteobacteria bacterium]